MGWIVGPIDQGPRSASTNMVTQAPTTRSMDLICHRWPTWAPWISNDKRKSPTVKTEQLIGNDLISLCFLLPSISLSFSSSAVSRFLFFIFIFNSLCIQSSRQESSYEVRFFFFLEEVMWVSQFRERIVEREETIERGDLAWMEILTPVLMYFLKLGFVVWRTVVNRRQSTFLQRYRQVRLNVKTHQ